MSVLLAGAGLTACGEKSDSGAVGTEMPVAGIDWLPVSVTVDGRKYDAPLNGRAEVHLNPGKAKPGAGGASGGVWGCNSNGVDLHLEGDTFKVSDHVMTKRGCSDDGLEEFEGRFNDVFDGTLEGRLSDGGRKLTLTKGNGDRIVLSSVPRRPLVGTKWKVTGFTVADGPGEQGRPVEAPGGAYLVFGKGGGVSGSLGCNSFRARAQVKGDEVEFAKLSSTRRMCAGGVGRTEELMRQVLAGRASHQEGQREMSLAAQAKGENGKAGRWTTLQAAAG